ncbi:MAG: thermosome subunit [Methanosarcinales archaeon]|nr:thermosome subunit [Methanosarcinales archaeon]
MYENRPVIVINPNKEETKGKDAVSMNIAAAKAVANIVKTTLGPKGMDKMLVNGVGDIYVTNDGATILKEMDVEHPTAKMVINVARTQELVAGDGTTSAVVVTSALLENAEKLLEQGVHATVIIKGYALAAEKAMEILNDNAIEVSSTDKNALKNIASTSITGKASELFSDHLSEICVDAILAIKKKMQDKIDLKKSVIIIQKPGKEIKDTKLIKGIILDKTTVHPSMPKEVKNPKIALIDTPLEIKKTSTDSKLHISTPNQLESFIENEKKSLRDMADMVAKLGVTVLLCSKNIDESAAYYLQQKNICAISNINTPELESLSSATGAQIVRNIKEFESSDFGSAGSVEVESREKESFTYIQDCPNAKTVTIIIRGRSSQITDNVDRALDDALNVVKGVVEDGKIVAGGGATEIEIALELSKFAASIEDRTQLAIMEFANAIEFVPKIIAENAGQSAIDSLIDVRAAHGDNKRMGLDVTTGEAIDMYEAGIVDPLKVKIQTIKSATEAANMVLKIDSVLKAKTGDRTNM